MMTKVTADLDQEAYSTKIKLPKYNGAVNVFGAVTSLDAAKILLRLKPDWSREDHQALAKTHKDFFNHYERLWSETADDAARAAFGRNYSAVLDYRISGIACEEFSDEHKNLLRDYAHRSAKHIILSGAHTLAAARARPWQKQEEEGAETSGFSSPAP